MSGKLMVLVGAQYGSEGKGVISNHLRNKYEVYIRVGAPNAGHTFYDTNNDKHVMQIIPCGWTNPNNILIIGRGSLINMEILMREIDYIKQYSPGILDRLYIDSMAGILDPSFHEAEGGVNGEMHKRIGSTGEGVGVARIARINRDTSKFRFFKDVALEYNLNCCLTENTPEFIAHLQDAGHNILVEGTQGSALSLIHGFYPYVTSIDTNASGILSECGIAPNRCTDVLLVARSYPIRVAGNSGYMKDEVTWDYISKITGKPTEEKTTVTKKVRRIAKWDDELFKRACILNNPTEIALTFADYIDPKVTGMSRMTDMTGKIMKFVRHIKMVSNGVPVTMIGTGGQNCSVVETGMGAYK